MFKKLSEQLKANPRTIVFTEGTDARILEAADKLTAEGVLSLIHIFFVIIWIKRHHKL